jgi:AraC-like DNA-binding protein
MTVVARDPHPALRGRVRSPYYGFEERTDGVLRRREGPDASVVVVLSFGNEWRIGDTYDAQRLGRFTSFVAGFHSTSVVTEHDGWSAGMQVNLAPPAAFALLRTPLHELAERTVALDDVLGPGADELVERLARLPAWGARFELLDAALARRLADAPPVSDGVAWAWRRLVETHGRERVATIAGELGWSRRRLAAGFREQVGVPPKTVARLLRFERAADLLQREPPPSWASLAFACGFYDQSHLINEFRSIAGVTPGAFAAA